MPYRIGDNKPFNLNTSVNTDLEAGGSAGSDALVVNSPSGDVGQGTAGKTSEPSAPAGKNTGPSSGTTTGKAAEITSVIPDVYKASSYAELIPEIQKRMRKYRPLSDADLAKLRRRQKAEGIVAGISDAVMSLTNLVAAHNYAPDMFDANTSMTARTKERFEREKAEREAADDKYMNYALMIGKMRGEDADRGLKVWSLEQQLARQDKDRKEDVEFRNKDFDERVSQFNKTYQLDVDKFEESKKQWDLQFKESIRQFNINASMEKARIELEAKRLAYQMAQGRVTFNLGSGHGDVTLTTDRLNSSNIARVFSTLPAEVRNNVQGDPIYGTDEWGNKKITGYGAPSSEAMLVAIGANVDKYPETQNALRQIAGQEKGTKPKAY